MAKLNVKDAIKTAIQMEKDGHAFYTKAAGQTKSDLGRTVFESLAADELVHLETFQKIFQGKIDSVEWNTLVKSNSKYTNLTIFPKDLKTTEGTNPNSDELDALRMGMDSEKEAIDYYTTVVNDTSDAEVKEILTEIINQEKNHYRLLQQEFTHLSSTGLWYDPDPRGA
ncbi:MAG TPA: ferritin family protein [Candidatus Thermoplasmatota archaeon]|nr:ferritin family protein [Candidatus Thermoplasmatota archaeon]